MFNWFKRKPLPVAAQEAAESVPRETPRMSAFAIDAAYVPEFDLHARLTAFMQLAPKPMMMDVGTGQIQAVAMDSGESYYGDGPQQMKRFLASQPNLSDGVYFFFGRQGFIGHQMAALVSQNWMIQKACVMPARDALRKGWELRNAAGDSVDDSITAQISGIDKRLRTAQQLQEFITMGRIFGIRIAIPDVRYVGDQAEARRLPFNIDGVVRGSFKGWIQVDPYWTAPMLDNAASGKPDSKHFYEPTWWQINGQLYHRSHLCIYRHGVLPDILKPAYQYGGIPVPQLIMERVYNAERTANEAPLLAMTKRTVVYKTDIEKATAQWDKFHERTSIWSRMWNNLGIRVIDKEADEHEQFDTSLADLDAVIMTQFQLVASAAEVPATKLLGTSAKGFNATGEHDESNYHESLESIQNSDLTPMLERHYELLCYSAGIVVEGGVTVEWPAMDAPTELERAQTEQAEAGAAAALIGAGVVDPSEERKRLARSKNGMYAGVIDDGETPEDY